MSVPDGADLARYYDLDLVEDPGDLDMYLALAEAYAGQILELAAGSGRISVALAAAGYEVTGVDRDPAMLERARTAWRLRSAEPGGAGGRRRGSLELVEHDITTLQLDRRFGLVILALNTLLLLDRRDAQRAALEMMARHLAPNGRAVIDIWLPTPDDLVLYDGRLVLEWLRRDEATTEWVAKSSSARYEPATATAAVTTFFDAWRADASQAGEAGNLRRTLRHDEVSFIGASELVDLAGQAGLEVDTVAGDYSMTPFTGGAERIVLVGRLPAPTTTFALI